MTPLFYFQIFYTKVDISCISFFFSYVPENLFSSFLPNNASMDTALGINDLKTSHSDETNMRDQSGFVLQGLSIRVKCRILGRSSWRLVRGGGGSGSPFPSSGVECCLSLTPMLQNHHTTPWFSTKLKSQSFVFDSVGTVGWIFISL